jgi:hypothetical protein
MKHFVHSSRLPLLLGKRTVWRLQGQVLLHIVDSIPAHRACKALEPCYSADATGLENLMMASLLFDP